MKMEAEIGVMQSQTQGCLEPPDYSHPGGCQVVSYCGFDLYFPDD